MTTTALSTPPLPMISAKRILPADFGGVIFPKRSRKGKIKDGERGDDEFFHKAPISSGNRCGHDPKHPRLVSLVNPHRVEDWNENKLDDFGSKRKSHFFYETDVVLDDFYTYPRMMPELGFVRAYTDNSRQRNSAGREAITVVLKYIVHHMCLVTKRLGYPSKDGFQYFNQRHISLHTGLSTYRVKEALRKIVAAKYIERKRRYVKDKKGKFIAITSITTVNTDLLFGRLDLLAQFKKASTWAKDRLNTDAKDLGIKVKQMVTAMLLPAEHVPKIRKQESSEYRDYPDSHLKHWLLQLPKQQHLAFNNAALSITLNADERGLELSKQDIYSKAFNNISID